MRGQEQGQVLYLLKVFEQSNTRYLACKHTFRQGKTRPVLSLR